MSKSKPRDTDRHKTRRRQIYINGELGDRIDALAKLGNRPLAWELAAAIEHWIERHNAKAKPEDRV